MENGKYVFKLSPYDTTYFLPQVSAALEKRTESVSRERFPGLWEKTDKLNERSKGEKKNTTGTKIKSIICLLLGIFLFVPGMMEPQELLIPLLVGAVAKFLLGVILIGLLLFLPAGTVHFFARNHTPGLILSGTPVDNYRRSTLATLGGTDHCRVHVDESTGHKSNSARRIYLALPQKVWGRFPNERNVAPGKILHYQNSTRQKRDSKCSGVTQTNKTQSRDNPK